MSKYKFGKQKKTLDPEEFKRILKEGPFVKKIHRGFLVILYYLGLRVSELLPLEVEDFVWGHEYVRIEAPAIKMGVERPPFKLSLTLPGMHHLFSTWKAAKKRKTRVFPFTRQTACNIVKRVMPEHYPHYFRLNRATSFLNKGWPPNKIRRWFGWKTFKTVESYLGYAEKDMAELSEGLE